MSRSVRRSLEEAGRQPVPPPDPSFVDTLESRLLAVAATAPPSPEPPPHGTSSRLRLATYASGIAALAAVLVLIVVIARPEPSLELIAPSNVQVALEDGTTLEDPAGLLVPEGAVVTVGARGSARIGDTLLTPGDVATISDGRLHVRHEPSLAVASPSAMTTATPRAAATPVSGTPTPAPQTTSPARPATTPSPDPAPPTTHGPTPRPEPSPTSSAATPAPTPAILRPRLKARLVDGRRIAVTWTETRRARRYVLVVSLSRSGQAAAPAYPGSRVLGEFAAPPAPALRYRVPAGVTEVRLMVVALRKDGSVLRRSRVVTITLPPSGDAAGSGPDASATPTLAPVSTPTVAPEPTPTPAP